MTIILFSFALNKTLCYLVLLVEKVHFCVTRDDINLIIFILQMLITLALSLRARQTLRRKDWELHTMQQWPKSRKDHARIVTFSNFWSDWFKIVYY